MKYIPILFNTEMVKAILEGRKTQTRREMKIQPDENGVDCLPNAPLDWNYERDGEWKPYFFDTNEGERHAIHCPFGEVGDILWVRETWQYEEKSRCVCPQGAEPSPCDAYTSHTGCESQRDAFIYKADDVEGDYPYPWRPSIHMPKKACRLFLKITNVRVERLQDISEADAIAEGVEKVKDRAYYKHYQQNYGQPYTARESFQTLWTSVYGAGPWVINPWVWVINFKQVEKPRH